MVFCSKFARCGKTSWNCEPCRPIHCISAAPTWSVLVVGTWRPLLPGSPSSGTAEHQAREAAVRRPAGDRAAEGEPVVAPGVLAAAAGAGPHACGRTRVITSVTTFIVQAVGAVGLVEGRQRLGQHGELRVLRVGVAAALVGVRVEAAPGAEEDLALEALRLEVRQQRRQRAQARGHAIRRRCRSRRSAPRRRRGLCDEACCRRRPCRRCARTRPRRRWRTASCAMRRATARRCPAVDQVGRCPTSCRSRRRHEGHRRLPAQHQRAVGVRWSRRRAGCAAVMAAAPARDRPSRWCRPAPSSPARWRSGRCATSGRAARRTAVASTCAAVAGSTSGPTLAMKARRSRL